MSDKSQPNPATATAPKTADELCLLTCALRERVKELDCLYGFSHIVENAAGSLEYILVETVKLLRSAWEYPDITCARIVVHEDEFTTDNYSMSPWIQRAPLHVYGEHVGDVEVYYLEERPQRHEGPFHAEERKLLDAIAERLGHTVERFEGESLLREKEHELRERLTHLSRVSTMGEMASNIAHEVNQPLTAIGTYAQACQRLVECDAISSQEIFDVLTRITDEALRAGGIIHRLKDLARKRDSALVQCDLNELIRSVQQLAAVDTRLHDTQLRLVLSHSLPHVLADGIQIQQVILNLIRNGVDAMDGTDIDLKEVVVRTVKRKKGEVEVSVSDNGCGLPETAGDELFTPFFTTKEAGIGVGLSISRSIVDAHGGRMWFSRNPDRGTTFFFSIPILPEVSNGAA